MIFVQNIEAIWYKLNFPTYFTTK